MGPAAASDIWADDRLEAYDLMTKFGYNEEQEKRGENWIDSET